jgi:hypothetical protein
MGSSTLGEARVVTCHVGHNTSYNPRLYYFLSATSSGFLSQIGNFTESWNRAIAQSPTCKANSRSACQETCNLLRGPKVKYYRLHNRLPPHVILSQMDPVHTFSKPFLSRSAKWSSSSRHLKKFWTYFFFFMFVTSPPPTPSHAFHDTWSKEQIMKIDMQVSQAVFFSISFWSRYASQ